MELSFDLGFDLVVMIVFCGLCVLGLLGWGSVGYVVFGLMLIECIALDKRGWFVMGWFETLIGLVWSMVWILWCAGFW